MVTEVRLSSLDFVPTLIFRPALIVKLFALLY